MIGIWRAIASNLFTLVIVAMFLAIGGVAWGQRQWQGEGPLAQAICLEVPSGSTMNRVSENLDDLGAVSSAWVFKAGVDYSRKAGDLKAGSFLVEPGASMEEILEAITASGRSTCGNQLNYRIGVTRVSVEGRRMDPATREFDVIATYDIGEPEPAELAELRDAADTQFRIVVAEGATSWQVVNALNGIDLLDGNVAEIPAEGTLAPRDYSFAPGETVAGLLSQMQDLQEQRLAAVWASRAEGLPLNSPEEALILASIVEKETGVPEERPQVASVFINRLRQGMKLQTDPTVIYGITRGEGVLGRGLRRSELRRETPWNTYVIPALPPTPIANPGLKALEATLNPDSTPYIFFVADGTGGHAFAETLGEHNRNVARWREIEAERAATQGD